MKNYPGVVFEVEILGWSTQNHPPLNHHLVVDRWITKTGATFEDTVENALNELRAREDKFTEQGVEWGEFRVVMREWK